MHCIGQVKKKISAPSSPPIKKPPRYIYTGYKTRPVILGKIELTYNPYITVYVYDVYKN